MVTAIVTIVMFLVMVSLHEFGHFIVGKIFDFKILEYAIGFGPAIFKKQKGETLYALRVIPFGGYCRFEGEDGDSDDPRAFSNKAVWKRMCVVVAGGLSNIILGFAVFVVLVALTSPMYTNTVADVVPNSNIEAAGIMPGDKIVSINGKHVSCYSDITLYTQKFAKDESAEVTVKRNGEKITFDITPTEQKAEYSFREDGIVYKNSVNGHTEEQFIEYSDDNPKNEENIGKTQTTTKYIIGFYPETKDVNIFNVWGEAWNQTRFVVKLVYNSLWEMVTGKIGVDQMSGPVGIVNEVNNAVNSGEESYIYILNLVGLLTINLGVFNLLPIPALDGGRLFFMIIELIRRKPIPPEKEGMVHAVGMMILFAFIIFISYHDIMRLFR